MSKEHYFKPGFLLFIFLITLFSCREEGKLTSFDGKKIKEIKSNVIYTEDNQELVLNEDSISKIFYLVRHAEKDTLNKEEPGLTPQGFSRAAKITDIMRGTRVDAIYSTMKLRALYTVDSLADIKSMSVLPYDNQSLRELFEKLKTSDELNRIFIVGHSNTIPSIANTLAGRNVFSKTFEESEYDNFIIVVLKKSGVPDVYAMKY